MNIEVGEYIRTKDGRIGKLDEIYYAGREIDLPRYYDKDLYNNYYIIKYNADDEFGKYSGEEIVNHSKNILDLVEVGDYVNGHLIVDVDNINTGAMREIYCEDDKDFGIWDENIETIVTKEQFFNREYKV